MEYTLYELREMLNYMDAQLQDQAPYFDDRLLSRRRNVAQAVTNLEEAARTLQTSQTEQTHRASNAGTGGDTWGSM
jgi:t-SNARE complex subunit (syntaxin)